MSTKQIVKRLYNDYIKKYIFKIFLAAFFSILVAGSTSATAWLLDPAIENIFLNKDETLIYLIPLAIIIAFSTKGISLYLAKILMIQISEEVKKMLQTDMLRSFINADTQIIESKHTGKYISNLIDEVRDTFISRKTFFTKKKKSFKIMHITNPMILWMCWIGIKKQETKLPNKKKMKR